MNTTKNSKSLSAKEIVDNMTKGEWIQHNRNVSDIYDIDGDLRVLSIELITGHGGDELAEEFNHNTPFNAEAIVRAVNNTYLKNIDPDGVADLLAALKKAEVALQVVVSTERAKELFSVSKMETEVMPFIRAAIQKAEIK